MSPHFGQRKVILPEPSPPPAAPETERKSMYATSTDPSGRSDRDVPLDDVEPGSRGMYALPPVLAKSDFDRE